MAKNQRTYTREFKQEAVRLLENSDKAVAEIAQELGINPNNLYRWRAEYGQGESVGGSPANRSELEGELKRLRRENEVLRQERDILKKAISIVGRSQP